MSINNELHRKIKKNVLTYMNDDGSVLASVMLGNDFSMRGKNKFHNQNTSDGKITDKRQFVCPKCNRGWEYLLEVSGSGGRGRTLY